MKQTKVFFKKLILSFSAIVIISVFLSSCTNCPECPPVGTTEVATTPQTATADFYHLKLDSNILVDSFFKKNPSQFKKILLNYKVNNYSQFPSSLTLNAYAAKNNDDIQDDNPEILDILSDKVSLPTDIVFSTLELSRAKLRNLVGNTGEEVKYKWLVFIPYVKDTLGRKFLSYRVEGRPINAAGAGGSENLNPCPPYKPE